MTIGQASAEGAAVPLVVRSDSDAVATLTLNRPDQRNAVNRALFKELRAHIRDLEQDREVGVVVLRGAGGHFCGGHDLKEPSHPDALGWLRAELHTLEKLTTLRQIVIAAVEGACYTGGLEMALSCDFIVCDETARFADTHAKWGLVPGWGMSQRLPRRVGSAKAIEMMTTCRPYTGRQAEAMGLANVCTEPGKLDEAVQDFATAILANSRHAVAENKKLVYQTDGMRLAEGLDHEVMRNAGFDRERGFKKKA
jgi:enoyl-CoA hydratase/carnithine racemase